MNKFISSSCYLITIICILFSFHSLIFTDFFTQNIDKSKSKITLNNERGANTSYYSWKSNWRDYDYNFYSGTTKVRESDVLSSTFYKSIISPSTWGDLYYKVHKYDKSKLDLVYPMLDRIWNNNNFTRREFADVVVSFVQNIPYKLLTQNMTLYGLYTPLEFMANMNGDCDTRTVFLYTVLKRYNYDVVILDSEHYLHSMIGLNIPSSGRYKYHQGKRYYTWETTNTGWRLGLLPPNSSNINYWQVAF
mgnify:CR=1 FL=1